MLARARVGDEDAFRELHALHLSAVRAVGRTILRGRDVEDVCQDTFLLAFTRLERFEGKCTFRSWITRIAINQCLLALRRERQVTNGDGHLVPLDGREGSVDAQLQEVTRRLDLERLMLALPADERRLVRLYLDGRSRKELADLLGTSAASVRRTLYKARRRMRRNK